MTQGRQRDGHRRTAADVAAGGALLALSALLALWSPAAAAQNDTAPPAGADPIQVGEAAVSDAEITERLTRIFGALESLENVRVRTESGIVTLEGEVLTARAREQAGALASRIEGVVQVENRISEAQDVTLQLERVGTDLRERGLRLLRKLPLVAVALVVVLLSWWIAGWLSRRERLYARMAPNTFVGEIFSQIVRLLVTVFGLIMALEILDASALIGSVLGALGLAGLALGFALKDTVENYVASVLMSLRQPFAPGDHVLIEGREGKVIRLTSRATVLMTFDGNHLRIPNATVFKSTIENFTRNPNRRFTFTLGITPSVDPGSALEVATQALRETPGVLYDPAPGAWISAIGDSTIELGLAAWIDQRSADYLKVKSEAIRQVKVRLEEAGIDMPAPEYLVNLRRPGLAPERAAAPAPAAGRKAEAVDVTPDDAIDRQLAEDRAETAHARDLLSPRAPIE